MDDLIQDFLTETSENLVQLDLDLVNLEKDHNNKDLLSNIFRTIHTIKGTCGFIGLPRLEKVAHCGENVLGKFRDGELEVTPEAITAILQCIDLIKSIMGTLETTGQEPEGDDSALINKLEDIANGGSGEGSPAPQAASPPDTAEEPTPIQEEPTPTEAEVPPEAIVAEATETPTEAASEPTPPEAPEETMTADPTTEMVAEAAPEAIEKPAEKAPEPQKAAPQPAAEAGKENESSIANQSIRVNVSLLENLITTVSELVLARNQLLQIARNTENDDFKVPLQRLNHVTSELQEGLMRTRMQPIGTAWSKLPRIVRDLARDLKKEVELEMIGAETELDRQVIEIIKDPLTHMVRNSADHGLEMPDERIKSGKSKLGKITLNAYHAGGHIIIEISDDGRGLNKEKIKEKIVANGLSRPEDVESMTDSQLYQYIFAPGFSTAQQVTNISGRGVGMDVVRTNIEKIGGSVEVRSFPGQGSLFTIKIPLTLAIVSALIIRSCDQKFAIPQVSIIELVRASNNSEHTIEYIDNFPVLRLRNKILPLISLNKLLGLASDTSNEVDELDDNAFIIVTQVGSGHFGLIVDEVYDTEEIVVKPVSPLLRQINLFAGNTILGDGSVVMILDPKGVASKIGDLNLGDNLDQDKKGRFSDDRRMRFLLFRAGDMTPKAVPLALVVRLEELSANQLETSNGRSVVQYRDKLMPLISLSGSIHINEGELKHVLVFSNEQEFLGLVVDEIIDIVEDEMSLKLKSTMSGSYGSTVIADRTTDLIDVDSLIQQVYPNWGSLIQKGTHHKPAPQNIILIDKCELYRNILVPFLEIENYQVLSFDSAEKALSYIENDKDSSDSIVVDAETLGDGVAEFVKQVRDMPYGKEVPIFLISTSCDHETNQSYVANGYTACLSKEDRETLIANLSHSLSNIRSQAA